MPADRKRFSSDLARNLKALPVEMLLMLRLARQDVLPRAVELAKQ
jgi:hypothetical protein